MTYLDVSVVHAPALLRRTWPEAGIALRGREGSRQGTVKLRPPSLALKVLRGPRSPQFSAVGLALEQKTERRTTPRAPVTLETPPAVMAAQPPH